MQQEPLETQTETKSVSDTLPSNSPLLPKPDLTTNQIPNPENNLVIKSLNEEDDAYKTPSFFVNPLAQGNSESQKQVREMKLFPIFEDHQLAKSSINYFLYLEFYHIAIRLFVQIFLFSLALELLFFLAVTIGIFENTAYAKVIGYAIGGVSNIFLLKYGLKKEDTRLLDHEVLYNFQWSEDLFSLLLTNIPKKSTKVEIQEFLQDILQKKNAFNTNVQDIIFVHDYYRFTQLSKNLKTHHDKLTALNSQQSPSKKITQQKIQLEQKISALKIQLDSLQKEIQDFKHFKGTAIVIFNTIEAKNVIFQHFTMGKLKSLAVFFFGLCFKSHHLKGQKISVMEIPEPHNLLVENLHYPLSKRIWRTPLAYCLSSAVFIAALIVLGTISGWKLSEAVANTATLLENKFSSYSVALITMIIAAALESIYQKTQNLFAYSSALRADISMVNYNMYITFLLYVLIQILLGYGKRVLWIEQLVKLSLLYLVKKLVMKAFAFIGFIKKKESEQSKGFLTSFVDKAKKQFVEFDFTKGLAYAFPLIFMGLAFIVLDTLVLLPIFIASLYIFAVIDKYRMLNQCNVHSTKSAKFMLVHFWIFNWAPFLASYFSIIIIQTYMMEVAPDAENNFLYGLPMFLAGIGTLFSMCCGKPLDQRVTERFAHRNAQVEYASVSKEFSSFYQREDYSGNIKFSAVL